MLERTSTSGRARPGLSLLEMLVVVTLISILIALLLPAVQKAREAANRTQCQEQMRQLGLAVHGYHDVNKHMPPGRIKQGATWYVFILPYISQDNVHKQFDYKKPWPDQPNVAAVQTLIPTFVCPTRRAPMLSTKGDGREGISDWPWPPYDQASGGNGRPLNKDHLPGPCGDYAGSSGIRRPKTAQPPKGGNPNQRKGVFVTVAKFGDPSPVTFASIRDGLASTLMIGEKHVRPGQLGMRDPKPRLGLGPKDIDSCIYNGVLLHTSCRFGGGVPLASSMDDDVDQDMKFGSWHPGICNFVFCDGSVRALKVDISVETLRLLVNRGDGKVIEDPF